MVNISMSKYFTVTWRAERKVIGWIPNGPSIWLKLSSEELVESLKLVWISYDILFEVNSAPSLTAAKVEILSEMWG